MSLKRRRPLARLILSCVLLLAIDITHGWGAARVAVLYPKAEEPYYTIFQNILRGIEANPNTAAKPYPLPENFDSEQLRAWLQEERIQAIIALGKQGWLAAKATAGTLPVIVGALPVLPDDAAGISLAPDPGLLFQQLRALAPQVERVHVVYSENSAWLMKQAEAAAKSRGLRFSAYPVSGLREAVHQYDKLLQTESRRSEAFWLPLDNITANDEAILPMLLQAAWDKNLVVFSSKPSHAQRGVLFSVFPDHYAMGHGLGEMASLTIRAGTPPGVLPLTNLQLAVNLRTAAHLGLRFSPRQQAQFDLVFPSQ